MFGCDCKAVQPAARKVTGDLALGTAHELPLAHRAAVNLQHTGTSIRPSIDGTSSI